MRPWYPLAFLIACILTLSPLTAAAADCGPDCIGIYFDQAGTEVCHPGTMVGTVTAYLILSDPTMDALSFISFGLEIDGPATVAGVNFGNAVICDPLDPHAYCTMWDPALLTTSSTTLAVITIIYTGLGQPALISIRNSGAIVDDRPWVILPNDVEVPLNPATGPGNALAQIGGACGIVPTEASSWGALKGLYR